MGRRLALAATADDSVLVAWEGPREGAEVYMARSLDAGSTFTAAVGASTPRARPHRHGHGPKLVFVGSKLVVIADQRAGFRVW